MKEDGYKLDRETGRWVPVENLLPNGRGPETPRNGTGCNPAGKRRSKTTRDWVQYHYEEQLELAKSSRNVLLAVQAELFHLHFKSWDKTTPITLGNSVVQSLGFHPTGKIRALKDLEKAGWITVQWRKRQSPLVTIVKGFKH
jgi:hypothetical protein